MHFSVYLFHAKIFFFVVDKKGLRGKPIQSKQEETFEIKDNVKQRISKVSMIKLDK